MILAPLVGIIVNMLDASAKSEFKEQNDVVGVFASMDCPETMNDGFQYMLEYNWVSTVSLVISQNSSCFFVLYGICTGVGRPRKFFFSFQDCNSLPLQS